MENREGIAKEVKMYVEKKNVSGSIGDRIDGDFGARGLPEWWKQREDC